MDSEKHTRWFILKYLFPHTHISTQEQELQESISSGRLKKNGIPLTSADLNASPETGDVFSRIWDDGEETSERY